MASKLLTSFFLLFLYLVSLSNTSLTSISSAVEVLRIWKTFASLYQVPPLLTRLPREALTNLPTLRSNSSLTVTNSSRSRGVNPSIKGVGVNSEALQPPEDSL
ncbi:hypothetical protein F2Q68_00039033 [Brassica cretica]|uniref:Uncharacterized protein n=2 Tax=Brassica cretica TaxID=69181 RepID=A0ABQ7ALK4_BRACR|nr:hypothetical protein F2Q68_00039033 [Brassica cretica]KAF3498579.1 hypothetical protein DY000_02052614 [Brassica cretica]